MIEFKGKITGKTLKFYVQRYKRLFVFSSLVASIIMLLLFGGRYFYTNIILILDALSLPLLFLICPPGILGLLAPHRVYIDTNSRTIVSEINNSSVVLKKVDDIIEVKDHGEFYTFKFNSLRYYHCFLVQKDLIAQGTIEEFEKLFEEVLIRAK